MDQATNNLDEKVFLALNGNHSEFLDNIMLFASNLFSLIPIFILIIFVVNRYYKKQADYPLTHSIILTGVLLLFFLFSFKVLPGLFSAFFEREKPCLNPNISVFVRLLGENCNTGNNFFAVRPCIMFCIATFLLFTIKHDFIFFRILLIFWALLVSYSRIYLGAHYPLNVLISDIVGILVGFIGSRFYFYLRYNVLFL
jgi:undecaprenyl-diphosphatase